MTIKMSDITGHILNIEKKYNLFEREISGIFFWKLIRFKLTSMVFNSLEFYEKGNKSAKRWEKFNNIIVNDFNTIKKNALTSDLSSDVLVFQSPRRINYNNSNTDIYTFFINKELLNQEIKLKSVNLDGKNKESNKEVKVAMLPLSLQFVASHLYNVKFSKEDKRLIQNIKDDLNHKFSIDINIMSLIIKQIKKYRIQFSYYNKLFSKNNIRKIFIVCSYGLEPLISAAKKHNIEVIEIQHGTISPEHMGYHFPGTKSVPYFPDKILLFGDYWKETTCLPLDDKNIISYGYPYFTEQQKEYRHIEQQKNSVLFISQWTIGTKLVDIAFNFAERNPELQVEYKLHPKEYESWEQLYPKLVEAKKLSNFKLCDSSRNDLYEVLNSVEYVVGVYSTVLYEALALGKKTILMKLPGVENMKNLVENKIVFLVSNELELKECLTSDSSPNRSGSYFIQAKPNNKELFDLFN